MNNLLPPVFASLLGWLERQGNFTAIMTILGIFFLAVYLWRTALSNRRAKQKTEALAPKAESTVDFKNPYAADAEPVAKADSVGKSFDRMLSPPDQPPSRAFRVYTPHGNGSGGGEGDQAEDVNRTYVWE